MPSLGLYRMFASLAVESRKPHCVAILGCGLPLGIIRSIIEGERVAACEALDLSSLW